MPRNITPKDYTSFTITATAGTMFERADSGFPTSTPKGARSFRGRLETAQIRARGDETDPTSSEGELLEVGDDIYIVINEFTSMNFIRTGSVSGVCKGHFYDVELSILIGGS